MPGVRWLTGVGEVAYARMPMGSTRIPHLAVVRISAIYGECDWMSLIARDWMSLIARDWMSLIARDWMSLIARDWMSLIARA